MSNLIVIGFRKEADAFEMRTTLERLESRDLIDMGDVVVVTRDAKGKVQLHQTTDPTPAGAASGRFVGKLIDKLFPGARASAAPVDIGINDDFMKDLGTTLHPGNAALFVLVRKSTRDKVLDALKPFAGRGRVLQTSLPRDKEEELRAFMDGK